MDKFVVKNAECFFAAEKRSHLPVNITAKDRARNYPQGKGTFPPMWQFHGWIDYNGVAFSLELLE